jgi:hypothetical protein
LPVSSQGFHRIQPFAVRPLTAQVWKSDADARSSAPPCNRCGARRSMKMSDKDPVVLWCCAVCGNIWGTPRDAERLIGAPSSHCSPTAPGPCRRQDRLHGKSGERPTPTQFRHRFFAALPLPPRNEPSSLPVANFTIHRGRSLRSQSKLRSGGTTSVPSYASNTEANSLKAACRGMVKHRCC